MLSEGGDCSRTKSSSKATPVAMSCLDEEFELELWGDPVLKEGGAGAGVENNEGEPFAY